MWVTIIADASFCPDTKRAGYGFWIASSRGKYGGDGVLRLIPKSNISAEMMALLNGLHAAVKRGLVKQFDSVLLQTDCRPAIDAFTSRRAVKCSQEKELVSWYNSFIIEHKLHTRFKHVKGHTKNKDSRFVVNNICDRKARHNMRKARDAYRQNRIKEFLNDR